MLKWLNLSALVIVFDQLSKWWANSTLELYQSIAVLPFFNITLAYNHGAAFSFLAAESGWQRWFLSFIAIAISALLVWWLKRLPATNKILCSAYALVLAGRYLFTY